MTPEPSHATQNQLAIAEVTDTGRKRAHNEDCVGHRIRSEVDTLLRWGRLFVVADGVGGQVAGEVASRLAARQVLQHYFTSQAETLEQRLTQALERANRHLCQLAQARDDRQTMATTVVAAVVWSDQLVVASLGDSRAYLVRAGQIRQLTRDHSLVQLLVEEGEITPEQARAHPRRNVITRSLGRSEGISPDICRETIRPGDVMVLCTDGLYTDVSDAEIAAGVSSQLPEKAARQLVGLARRRGGRDNITISVVRVGEAVADPRALLSAAGEEEVIQPSEEAPPRRRAFHWLPWCHWPF